MALHQVRLPKTATLLFRVVVFQKRLLKALADPALDPNSLDTAWVQAVWKTLDREWVRKFCLGKKDSVLIPLKQIAAAPFLARQALFEEFCRQNKVKAMLNVGGDFKDLLSLPNFTSDLADAVKDFFGRCYELLGEKKARKWIGYEFPGLRTTRTISKSSYKDHFCEDLPTKVVCPYCDGEIGTPQLDHYMAKSSFPLLACSPWNLVPICVSCNDAVTAKGDRPAITLGPPPSAKDWLHPFFRPASVQVQIKLNGTPQNSIPQLYSPDPAEDLPLQNHTELIRSLSKRWTNLAAAHYDVLVREVNRKVNAANPLDSLVRMRLEDHQESRGRAASTLIHAAVCRAILEYRDEYITELTNPNPPKLI